MTDPTLAALSAAIAAHSDEDTPREQYKDRLQELAGEGILLLHFSTRDLATAALSRAVALVLRAHVAREVVV